MEKFKYNVYLGINNSNDICFAKVEMGEHFSCSFDASSPISVKSLNLNDLADGMIDVVDDSTKLEMCDYYNCSPANLSDSLAESLEDITNLQEFLDCSYYPEILNIGGEDYIFQAINGGQYDLRDDGMKIVHDEELFNTINDMWDKYHLKKDVPQNELSNLKTLLEKNTLDYDVEQSLISQDIANVLNLDISKEPADDLEM